jgi:hypothetical protein
MHYLVTILIFKPFKKLYFYNFKQIIKSHLNVQINFLSDLDHKTTFFEKLIPIFPSHRLYHNISLDYT